MTSEFTEPTSERRTGSGRDGPKGANCAQTTFTGYPNSTLGDWASTSGVDSPDGFGICTLTYGLVFDDYQAAYGSQPGGDAVEEPKARSVKDYWSFIVSDIGQSVLLPNDYSGLPQELLDDRPGRRGLRRLRQTAVAAAAAVAAAPGGGGGGRRWQHAPARDAEQRVLGAADGAEATTAPQCSRSGCPAPAPSSSPGRRRTSRKRFKAGKARRKVTEAGTYKVTFKPNGQGEEGA